MERFIIFIRNNKTTEEFVATRRAKPGEHVIVMETMVKRYPQPQFTVHTCYTDSELKDIIEMISRWTGSTTPHMTNVTPMQSHQLLNQHMRPLSVAYSSSDS
jgi:hypothetical protein